LLGVGAASADARKETLLAVVEFGPNTLDIHGDGANRPSYGVAWNTYDRLITYERKKLADGSWSYDYTKPKAELAESWKIAPDGMSVTFKLRKGAKFHDGSPVTAADVKWSYERALAVGGFPTFQMKAGSLEKPEQFVVVDDSTFLRKDKMTIPDLTVPVASVYNSTLAKNNATAEDPWAKAWLKTNAAGGGAYKVEKWAPGQEIVYIRNDEWKNGPLPAIKRVVMREVPSAGNRRAMLEKGDADISYDMPPKDVQELSKLPKLAVVGTPIENSIWYVGMNVTQPPFNNEKVRQAVAYVIPYDDLYTTAFYGRAIKLHGAKSMKASSPAWPQAHGYKTDLAKAKQLMKEAGMENGFETTLSFDLGQATVSEPIATLLQESLGKIGIKTTINKIPGSNWRAAIAKKDMPLIVNRFGGWLNYPEYFFFWNYHSQGKEPPGAVFNTMAYKNESVDKFIDAARFEQDKTKYPAHVKGFVDAVYKEVPRIPLAQPYLDAAMQKNITGYTYWFHLQPDFRQIVKN
jgi:peptide/nickel transport system substrate-binding protein